MGFGRSSSGGFLLSSEGTGSRGASREGHSCSSDQCLPPLPNVYIPHVKINLPYPPLRWLKSICLVSERRLIAERHTESAGPSPATSGRMRADFRWRLQRGGAPHFLSPSIQRLLLVPHSFTGVPRALQQSDGGRSLWKKNRSPTSWHGSVHPLFCHRLYRIPKFNPTRPNLLLMVTVYT